MVRGANWIHSDAPGQNFALDYPHPMHRPDLIPAGCALLRQRGLSVIRTGWNHHHVEVASERAALRDALAAVKAAGMQVELVFGGDQSTGPDKRGDITDKARYLTNWETILSWGLVDFVELLNEPVDTQADGKNFDVWEDWAKSAGWFAYRLRQVTDRPIVVGGARSQNGWAGFEPINVTGLHYAAHHYSYWYGPSQRKPAGNHPDKLNWARADWRAFWAQHFADLLKWPGLTVELNEFGIGRNSLAADATPEERWHIDWTRWFAEWAAEHFDRLIGFHATPTSKANRKRTYSVLDDDLTIDEAQFALVYPQLGAVAAEPTVTVTVEWQGQTRSATLPWGEMPRESG